MQRLTQVLCCFAFALWMACQPIDLGRPPGPDGLSETPDGSVEPDAGEADAGRMAAGTDGGSCSTECDQPPSSCYEPKGSCGSTGCVYVLKADAGTCANPCNTPPSPCFESMGTLTATGCTYAPKADGAQCGSKSAERCCAGTCVNISTDANHCGGCNTRCHLGRQCEPVSATSSCANAPADVTGRCSCFGASSECPRGQVCTAGVPVPNRCTPTTPAQCATGTTQVTVLDCPDFCAYPP